MLLYNHNKKLIGIDQEDLNILGFKHIEALLAVCEDIAELFVKKPGYIYDFKNFEWIDFVLNADAENTKVIVQTSKRHFTCDLVIKPFYMTATPEEEGYAIYLQHIHTLSGPEITAVEEPRAKPAATVTAATKPEITTAPEPAVVETPEEPIAFEAPPAFNDEPLSETFKEKEHTFSSQIDEIEDELPAAFAKPLEIEDDLFMDAAPKPAVQMEMDVLPDTEPAPQVSATGFYTAQEQVYIDKLTVSDDYVFDPHVASEELGLPVDLIEEFVGDFTKQSHEFYDELFDATAKSDFDNVKILSHKLKGVAANLRVEDALEMLTTINNSHDQIEIEANLKAFYRVIDKLEGKEVPNIMPAAAIPKAAPVVLETIQEPLAEVAQETAAAEDDDIYSFDLPTEAQKPLETAEEIENINDDEKALDDDLYAALPDTSAEDDLYSIDKLLNDSEQTAEEFPPIESASQENPPPFHAEEVELPPMDMSFLDHAPSEIAVEDTEPPPAFHYDSSKAAAELGLPVSLIDELKKEFTVDAGNCRNEFEEAISTSDFSKWQSCAATLKGTADNLRMVEIADALRILAQTSDAHEAEKSMEQLYSYVKQL